MKYRYLLLLLWTAAGFSEAPAQSNGSLAAGSITSTHVHQIYLLGDSILSNVKEIAPLLGKPWSVVNRAIPGDTTGGMLKRSTNEVINAGDAEYVVVFGGYNDLAHKVPVKTIQANLQTIYNAAHAANIRVVGVTLTPAKGSAIWSEGLQNSVRTLNHWIMLGADNVDFRVNMYSATADPANSDALSRLYDGGDHLHLSAAGYAAFASNIVSNVTFRPNANYAGSALTLSGPSVAANQNLRKGDSVSFGGLVVATDDLVASGDVMHRVGVGTANPEAKFEVNGDARINGALNASNRMTLVVTTNSDSGVIYKGNNRFLHDFSHDGLGLNVFLGILAGNFSLAGVHNVGVGYGSQTSLAGGNENVAVGYNSLLLNQNGSYNVGIGSGSLLMTTTGEQETAVGYSALNATTTGNYNTAVGSTALAGNTSGSFNSALGLNAGSNGAVTNTSYSTFLGYNTGATTESLTNSTAIGNGAQVSKDNQIKLGNAATAEIFTSGNLKVTGIPVFRNNAAALAGGLSAGSFYRTGADPDVLCVVH